MREHRLWIATGYMLNHWVPQCHGTRVLWSLLGFFVCYTLQVLTSESVNLGEEVAGVHVKAPPASAKPEVFVRQFTRKASSCASASQVLDAQAPGRPCSLSLPRAPLFLLEPCRQTEPLGPLGAGRSKNLSLTPKISFFALLMKSLVSLTTKSRSSEGCCCCIPRIYTMSRWPSATNLRLPLTHLPSQPTQSPVSMVISELEAHSQTLIRADNKKASSCKEKVESQCKVHLPGHKAFLRWVRSGYFS